MQTPNPVTVLFLALLLVGCSSTPKLMPTPNIYADGGSYPESSVQPGLRSNEVDFQYRKECLIHRRTWRAELYWSCLLSGQSIDEF